MPRSNATSSKATGGVSVDYLYDLGGHVITEVSASGGWNRGEVFAGSHHLATYNNGTTYFIHADWLATERVRANVGGSSVESCSNQPFGDNQVCTGTDVSPLHFTGKQRDTETNNDDFGARYFNSNTARWLTADWSTRPEGTPFASLGNPQTLNLYAYVGNRPTSINDPDGHEWVAPHPFGFGDLFDMPDTTPLDVITTETQENKQRAAQSNEQTRANVAATAEKYNGSPDWAFAAKKGSFACNTNKCNEFVGDVTKEAGAPVSVTGSDGRQRYPLAAELADPNTKIANWRVLGPNEKPQAGDIAAYKLPGHGISYSGHSGIVTSVDRNGTVHAIAAHEKIVGPDNKFNPGVGAAVVTYRRYTGDQ